jgi:hypothetical protein
LENSKRVIEDQLDNLLMRRTEAGSGQEQQTVQKPEMVLDYARSYLGDFPNAAEKAQSIYGTPEFNKLLNTELGKAVSDLYSVNKAKGDETGGEILSYIATEFPRAEDQSKAAQILMGLSYADKTKGLLKA